MLHNISFFLPMQCISFSSAAQLFLLLKNSSFSYAAQYFFLPMLQHSYFLLYNAALIDTLLSIAAISAVINL